MIYLFRIFIKCTSLLNSIGLWATDITQNTSENTHPGFVVVVKATLKAMQRLPSNKVDLEGDLQTLIKGTREETYLKSTKGR